MKARRRDGQIYVKRYLFLLKIGITMKRFRLPSLLGPLILGIFLRNISCLNIFTFFESWDSRNCSGIIDVNGSRMACREHAITSSGTDSHNYRVLLT